MINEWVFYRETCLYIILVSPPKQLETFKSYPISSHVERKHELSLKISMISNYCQILSNLDVSSRCVHICEVGSEFTGRVCVRGVEEFVPVGDCECGEVADAAMEEDGLLVGGVQQKGRCFPDGIELVYDWVCSPKMR